MKILQKILFVAMIGVFGWKVSGMIPPPPPPAPPTLNLPNNTPGLQGALQNRTINTVANIGCHHVIIPGTAAGIAFNNAGGIANVNAARAAAMAADGNIYFPRNGVQPTTPEAVQYSCANIDNRENSPITEWYMKMFGVIAAVAAVPGVAAVYVQAGWTNLAGPGQPVRTAIISFNNFCAGAPHANCTAVDSLGIHNTHDPYNLAAPISRIHLFIREFRKIASSSIGRVLLYRILIEINRHIAIGNNIGCTENPAFVSNVNGTRVEDRCRSIEIAYDDNANIFGVGFAFSDITKQILFTNNPNNFAEMAILYSVIGKSTAAEYTHIAQTFTAFDVALLHEMVHWLHHLTNPVRNYLEININRALHFNNTIISQYYWHGINCCLLAWNATQENNYAHIWSSGMPAHLDFEEMRTILGLPHNSNTENYLNGDDLSENLYRMYRGLPLRFGYVGQSFYEDRKVIDRVVNACLGNYIVYVTGRDNEVGFQYRTGRKIFGNGKVQ